MKILNDTENPLDLLDINKSSKTLSFLSEKLQVRIRALEAKQEGKILESVPSLLFSQSHQKKSKDSIGIHETFEKKPSNPEQKL
ncbi:MAG: hypothetical protein ACKOAD_01825 [Gammaproteobacteria bacterium]